MATAIIYFILILHLLLVFLVRSRVTLMIGIMIANLCAIFFYSLIISNPKILKELIIAAIIYSGVILAAINYGETYNIHQPRPKKTKLIIAYILAVCAAILVGSGIFYLAKNINQISAAVKEKQIHKQDQISKNPLISTSHSAHINVKKYYLEGNSNNEFNGSSNPIKEIYNDNFKQKIREGSLFNRLSDAIIIICGALTILFLTSIKNRPIK